MGARSLPATSLLVVALVACSGDDTAPADEALPCEVDAVLHAVCQQCHTSPPKDGVPIPLVTYADTQAPYTAEPTYSGTPTWKVMGDEIAAGLMPQPPVTITAADRATLLDWVERGAPAAPAGTTCP